MKRWSGEIFMIGAGSMAEAFIRGVTETHTVAPHQIVVTNRSRQERLAYLAQEYGVRIATSPSEAATARLIIVATKPVDVERALQGVVPHLHGQLLLSFAAGIPIERLRQYSQGKAWPIRTMPNIPVSVLAGMTTVTFGEGIQDADKQAVLLLLQQLGDVAEIPESLMDAATAVSGSGPGFLCYLLEAMEEAAVDMGFEAELARRLMLQTLVGTARTLAEWGLSPGELRRRVTSPGGTTFAGLEVMRTGEVHQVLGKALQAAAERSRQFSESLTV
ncbi:pyrroline-5-carboxylate reductase [Alicyclobacillus herbarius]|uniref:pyrroline-5-carboxylate reductase n=1 Tax=Alicyclobacillus herbarius TaxID=122960 RepID=UPI000405A603|nr:pyrroline-5-carboxylate reductase [Alicyclobacillus herbarius]